MGRNAMKKAVRKKPVGKQTAPHDQIPTTQREREEIFRHLAETIREVFWVFDQDSRRLLYVSPAYERVWGRSSEALYQDPASFLDTVHPDDRARIHTVCESQIKQGEAFDEQFRILRPDGSVRWIRERGLPIPPAEGWTGRFVGVAEDITEYRQAEEDMRRSLASLRGLAARLQSIREEERTRLAREIHDELGRGLTAIKMEASSLMGSQKAAKPRANAKAEAILQLVGETIGSVRRIATELRPPILDDMGLVTAVRWVAEEFQARTGTRCHLRLPGEDLAIEPERATALFRILQETLTNVMRHARATDVYLRLDHGNGELILEVRDNGKGASESDITAGSALGILGMMERALILGGKLTINGEPGKGTTVRAVIPKMCGEREDV